ncbi:hypothetical protein [Clostridium cochlearium]|uniref:hypothetical protein n=1 Tax=Clostridium cochlearium TaxID=1494 RepID=UPI00241CE0E9|nr:hypothetical protein [Clostridium cochlearium]MBE6065921.1 hypothetical protein [Clostridium cochlearium]
MQGDLLIALVAGFLGSVCFWLLYILIDTLKYKHRRNKIGSRLCSLKVKDIELTEEEKKDIFAEVVRQNTL